MDILSKLEAPPGQSPLANLCSRQIMWPASFTGGSRSRFHLASAAGQKSPQPGYPSAALWRKLSGILHCCWKQKRPPSAAAGTWDKAEVAGFCAGPTRLCLSTAWISTGQRATQTSFTSVFVCFSLYLILHMGKMQDTKHFKYSALFWQFLETIRPKFCCRFVQICTTAYNFTQPLLSYAAESASWEHCYPTWPSRPAGGKLWPSIFCMVLLVVVMPLPPTPAWFDHTHTMWLVF